MEATIQPDSIGEELSLVMGSHRLKLTSELLKQRPSLRKYFDRTVVLGIRPKDFEDSSVVPEGGQTITAVISNTEALGYEVIAHFSIDANQVVSEDALDLDDDAVAAPAIQDGTTMVAARFDPRTKARVGDEVQVVVDIDNAHFFDLETGQAIRDWANKIERYDGTAALSNEAATAAVSAEKQSNNPRGGELSLGN